MGGGGEGEGRMRNKMKEREKEGTEEMVQLLKCLPYEHEGMSLIPQNLNVACGGTCLQWWHWGGGSGQILGLPGQPD